MKSAKYKLFHYILICFHFVFLNIYLQHVSIYAAYLYDSVKLYANALHDLLKRETDKLETGSLTEEMILKIASNGTEIIDTIIRKRTYKSKISLCIFI